MNRRLLLVTALAAWGGQAPPPTFARIASLPPSVSIVAGFDATKLKATPLWSKIGTKLVGLGSPHERRDLDELRTLCDLDPFRDLRWVVVAGENPHELDEAVMIVNGAWSEQKLDRCAAAYRMKEDRARGAGRSGDDLAL